MGLKGSDFVLRLPESPEPGSPLRIAKTIDVTAWSDNSRPAGTRNFLGVGVRAKLHSISRPTPAPSTVTLRGPEDDLRFFIDEIRIIGCEFPIQRVRICDGRVESGDIWRQVTANTQTMEGATASGINATDNPAETVQELEWEGPQIHWNPPQDSRPAVYSNNAGYNFGVPEGVIDGVNDTFRLVPVPEDANLVVVFLDGVEQTVGVDYTLDEDTIIFDTPPDCGVSLLVYWTDAQSIINGLFPVSVVFCDNPSCGGGSCASKFSDGCRTFLALYQAPQAIVGCATEEFLTGALARYTLSRDGSVTLEDVNLLPNVVRPIDMACVGDQIIIAGAFGLFFACSSLGTSGCTCDCGAGGIVAIQAQVPVQLDEVKAITGAETSTGTTFYAVHNTNGVLRTTTGRKWEVSLPDGQFTTGQQNLISADGDIVATGGVDNSLQISRASGKSGSWASCRGPAPSSHDVIGLCVDLVGTEESFALIYVMTTDDNFDVGTLHITNDFGDSWEARQSWNLSDFAIGNQVSPAFFQNTLACAVDGSWVYMHYLTNTQRNTNFGRDCDWEDISTAEIQYPQNVLALCPSDPTKLIVVEQGLLFADFFTEIAADIATTTPFF